MQMPKKSKDIKGRHPTEIRVRVKARFNGYCHPFGITIKSGEEYDLSKAVVNKYNKTYKTKDGKLPFDIKGEPDDKKYSEKNSSLNSGSGSSLGSNPDLKQEGKAGAMTTKRAQDAESQSHETKELMKMRKNELVEVAELLQVETPDALDKAEIVVKMLESELDDVNSALENAGFEPIEEEQEE